MNSLVSRARVGGERKNGKLFADKSDARTDVLETRHLAENLQCADDHDNKLSDVVLMASSKSSIYRQRDSGDPNRVIGKKKQNGFRDVVRFAHPA